MSTSSTTSIQFQPKKLKTSNKVKQQRLDVSIARQKSLQDGGSRAADITNKLLFMLAKDALPYRTVEKEGFQVFMKTLVPLYKISSRKKIMQLMEEKYNSLSEDDEEQACNYLAHVIND